MPLNVEKNGTFQYDCDGFIRGFQWRARRKLDFSEVQVVPRRVAVMVLGMHRSGTSAVARVLSLLGCDLPKTLMAASESNEAGHWESVSIAALNDRILEAAGTNWHDWIEIKAGWFQFPKMTTFREEALAVLRDEYGSSRLFVLKDPRMCRIVPFWLQVLEEADVRPVVISPLRNPLEVVASLSKRDGLHHALGHLLWLRNVLDAEFASRGVPRFFTSYDRLMKGWGHLVSEAPAVLGLSWPRTSEKAVSEIADFLSEQHRHHRESAERIAVDPALSDWLRSAFGIMNAWTISGENPQEHGALDKIRREFDSATPSIALFAEPGREASGRIRQLEDALAAARNLFETERQEWIHAAEAAAKDLAETREKLTDAQRELAQVEHESGQSAAERIRLEGRLKGNLNDSFKLTQLLYEQEERVTQLLRELEEARRAGQAAASKVASMVDALLNQRGLQFLPKRPRLGRQIATLRRSRIFDAKWYLSYYKDVAEAKQEPLTHYIEYGVREGRAPNESLARLSSKSSSTPNHHNWAAGHSKGRRLQSKFNRDDIEKIRSSGLFDAGWYLEQYPDVAALEMDPIEHYLWVGAKLGRHPSPNFSTTKYLSVNGDVAAAGLNPLLHYARSGKDEGRRVHSPILHILTPKATTTLPENATALELEFKTLFREGLPAGPSRPTVSIIITAYNNARYSLRCLDSIRRNYEEQAEIIFIDDCSTDFTDKLAKIQNLTYLRMQYNQGYIAANNAGIAVSRGAYILFLNNDTEVTPGWLRYLVTKLDADMSVGAVGSKLIYPDGLLQEAGGIYYQDGRGTNYGCGDPDPSKPIYSYVREVDKCSGASLMVRRPLLQIIGGLDTRFSPAYKEDADLCFTIRSMGYRVLYQPASQVIHHEGVSNGTDTGSGVKRYQELNRPKFLEKWRYVLEKDHLPHVRESIEVGKERPHNRPVVLVVDDKIPEHDKHAGGMGIFQYICLFLELGYKVLFYPDDQRPIEPYTNDLQQLGVEVWYGDTSLIEVAQRYDGKIAFVWLSRPMEASKHIVSLRKVSNAPIIYCGRDLHYLRLERRGRLEQNELFFEEARKLKEIERTLFLTADLSLVFSHEEKRVIKELAPGCRVNVIAPYVLSVPAKGRQRERNSNVIFIGGFNHSPNKDAIEWSGLELFSL